MRHRKLWVGLAVVIVGSFLLLGYYGVEIYQKAPPVPNEVKTPDGQVVLTGKQIMEEGREPT